MDHQEQTGDVIVQAVDAISSMQAISASLLEARTKLQQSCTQAKEDIYSGISRQLEALRDREIWLLSQVDTVAHLKGEELQIQLAAVMQGLGSLEEKLALLQKNPDQPLIMSGLSDTLTRLNEIDFTPMEDPEISFQAKGDKLRRKIHSFGSVSSTCSKRPRLDYSYATGSSSALPNMFKGLGVKAPNEVFPVFAETQSTSYWLQDTKMADVSWHTTDTSSTFSMPFGTSQNVSHWLVKNDECEDTSTDDESLTMVHLSIKDETVDEGISSSDKVLKQMESILASPPDMWLNDAETKSYSEDENVPRLFSHFSSDCQDWLMVPTECATPEKSLPCACVMSGEKPMEMDIENLANLFCVQPHLEEDADISSWLVKSEDKNQEFPPIEKVCRANKLCVTYSECVCDDNCAGDAIQRSGDKNSLWLVSKDGSLFECFDKDLMPSDWLYCHNDISQSESMKCVDSEWLCEDVSAKEWEYPDERTSLSLSGNCMDGQSALDVLDNYHGSLSNSDWLNSSKKCDEVDIWLLTKKVCETEIGDSNKWLVEERKGDSFNSYQKYPFSFTKSSGNDVDLDLSMFTEKCSLNDWLVPERQSNMAY